MKCAIGEQAEKGRWINMIIKRDMQEDRILEIDGVKIEDMNDETYDKILSVLNPKRIQDYLQYFDIETELYEYEDLGTCDTCGSWCYERTGFWEEIPITFESGCYGEEYTWEKEENNKILDAIKNKYLKLDILCLIVDSHCLWVEDIGGIEVLELKVEV